MQPRAGAVVVILVALVVLAAPTLASVADGGQGPDSVGPDAAASAETGESSANGTTFGSQLSAFMQSSSTAANESVETGMWVQRAMGNPSDAEKHVEQRTRQLEDRLDRLEAKLDRLAERGIEADDPATAGQIARVTTRIQNLQHAINETDRVADRAGVNETQLSQLRSKASNLTGHQVAQTARNLSLGPPAGVGGGPPDDVPAGPPDDQPGGPDDNSTERPGNGSAGPPEDRPGGPDKNGSEHPGNGSSGPPDDRSGPDDNGPADGSDDNSTDDDDGPNGPPDDHPEDGSGDESPGNGSDASDDADRSTDDTDATETERS